MMKGFVTVTAFYNGRPNKAHWGKTLAKAKEHTDSTVYSVRLAAPIEIPDSEIISYLERRGFSVTRKLDNRP